MQPYDHHRVHDPTHKIVRPLKRIGAGYRIEILDHAAWALKRRMLKQCGPYRNAVPRRCAGSSFARYGAHLRISDSTNMPAQPGHFFGLRD